MPCDVFSLIKNAYSLAPTHSHTPQNDDLSNYLLVVAYNKSIWKKRNTCNEIIYIYILPNDVWYQITISRYLDEKFVIYDVAIRLYVSFAINIVGKPFLKISAVKCMAVKQIVSYRYGLILFQYNKHSMYLF